MSGYILGGDYTEINNYPHSVYIHITCNDTFICGGSILNQDIALTAAHCFEDCGNSASVHLKYGHSAIENMRSRSANGFIVHENYNRVTMANDIGLVAARLPLQLASFSKRIAIMKSPPHVDWGYVAGWGVINDQSEVAQTLKFTKQKLQSPKTCRKTGKLPVGSFCAGPVHGTGSPDRGDSAGHCVEGCTNSSDITINVGSTNKDNGFATTGHSFMIHENYNKEGTADIGMIKSRETLKLSSKISRVSLLKNPPSFLVAQLAGWGLVNEVEPKYSPMLKSLNQRVWTNIECIKLLGYMPPGTLCAGSRSSRDYAAPGDSGSALLIQNYIQIGLVSYKIPLISRSLIVYTDVAYYYSWIEKHANNLYCA